MPNEFDTYPLSAAVGTTISGLDLSQPLDAKTIRQLKDVLQDRHLLLFRGQALSPDQQAQFARHFGDTSQRELNKESAENNDNQYVSNMRADGIFGKDELDFHIGQLFLEDPLKALILYAVEIPASGGRTKFLNTEAVYDAMPDSLKDRLRGLRCRHARAYDKK
ncbi:MAG: TauD/TfdA family dioxygenase, partial [Pseudomonadota bacterium]|nr:TauD/TfdA family dioxygenase [Pseudomonadota bacterium]